MAEDYKVKKGDNLTKIAREKGVSLQELIDANPQVKDPNLIITGEKLNIPGTGEPQGITSESDYGVPLFDAIERGVKESDEANIYFAEEAEKRAPEPEELTKTDKKYYTPTPPVFDGNGSNFLDESDCVPNFQERNGDRHIKATVDNNTIIIFGRDRDPFRKNEDGVKENSEGSAFRNQQVSGYSNYMGAGAIDIIVGRGAPYPLSKITESGVIKPFNLPPLYLTRDDARIKGQDLRDGFKHPGYVMDAARIYISQMCQIDNYFNLPKFGDTDFGPHSAIIMKADKLRMHSRRDIKIVAGGDRPAGVSVGGNKDSNGFEITENPKIHLIAGNGDLEYQQPIPLGYNLVECLEKVIKQVEDLTQVVNNFYKAQKDLNAMLQEASYPVPGYGMTTFNPYVKLYGIIFQAQAGFDQTQINNLIGNLNSLTAKYLRGGPTYINSRHNTTN